MTRTLFKISIGFIVAILLIEIGNSIADTPGGDQKNQQIGNISKIITAGNESIIIQSTFDGYNISEKTVNGMTFHLVNIPGYGIIPNIGKPQLPAKRFLLALPPSSHVTGINILESNLQTLTDIMIYPYQPPLPDHPPENETDFIINETFYASNTNFPTSIAVVSTPLTYYGLTVIQVTLNPVHFNPALSEIHLYNTITLEIQFTPPPQEKKILPWTLEKTYQAAVINPNSIKHWYTTNERDTPHRSPSLHLDDITNTSNTADYLIITHDNFYPSIIPLAEWKHQKGLETKIVNLTDIYTEFPGDDNIAIKNFIIYTQINWTSSPGYIILIGDVDYLPTNYGLSNCATDLDYSTINGNDFLPDILLGRLSVHDNNELDIIVNKIINYEKNPYTTNTKWLRNATVFYGTDREAWLITANFVEFTLMYRGYTVNKWNENQGGTSRMAEEINAGLAFLSYREHGSVSGWSMGGSGGFYNWDVQSLTNGEKLPIVFSTTCNTGWFDDTSGDCFTEVWMKKQNGGAAAILGSSRVSYTGYNDELTKGFYKAMFMDQIYDFTGIMNQGKLYMYDYYGSGYTTELEYEMYNAFSDPALDVWTSIPKDLTVIHPLDIYVGTESVTVTVSNDEEIPLEGTSVTLWKEGEVYVSDTTDASGNATFVVTPLTDGNMTVTVDRHNCRPYVGTITVNAPFSMPLYEGWNLISITADNSWTAESLGENISGCNLVLRFNASKQEFDTHVVGNPYDDFPIVDGMGYFIRVSADTVFGYGGLSIPSVNVMVYEGWNTLGWFHDYSTTAQSLGENVSASLVLMFDASTQEFMTYVMDSGYDNFIISRGMAVFIQTSTLGWWQGEG